jgi:hypothetical protein
VHCSELNGYLDANECVQLMDALSGGDVGFRAYENARAVAAGRASIDTVAFTRCLAELSPARCATAGTAASCETRYLGTIADGQVCESDAECASPGARCEPRDCGAADCRRTCAPAAALGAPCIHGPGCAPGLVCDVTYDRCLSGDVGTACGVFGCDAGAWCDNGICKPSRGEGERCDSLRQCAGETSCVGEFRTAGAATCQRLTSEGDACDRFCLGNLVCDLSNPRGLGVCRPLPGRDQPCSFLVPCLGQTLRCGDQGVCIPRGDVGEPCRDGTCLPGQFCTDQLGSTAPKCQRLFEDGASGCRADAQCASHICDGDASTPGTCLARQPI